MLYHFYYFYGFLETGQRKTPCQLPTKFSFCSKPPLTAFPKSSCLPHWCMWWTMGSSAAWWPSLPSTATWQCWSSSTSLSMTTPITNQQKHGLVRDQTIKIFYIQYRQLQFGFWRNDPFYLSLGGLVIFLANGGTLSELELRLLYCTG